MAIEENTDELKDNPINSGDDEEPTESMAAEADTDTFTAPMPEAPSEPVIAIDLTKQAGPEVLKHLNNEVISKAREIRQQWNILRERLDKIIDSKGKIKDSVYEKVAGDYSSRLDQCRTDLLGIKTDIDNELKGLRHKEAEATRRVMEHEDTLEEAGFRHELGEYTDEEFQDISAKEKGVLQEARDEQDNLQAAINQYDDIFKGIDIDAGVPQELASLPTQPEPKAEPEPTHTAEAAPAAMPPPNVGAVAPRAVDKQGEKAPIASSEITADQPATLLLYENGQAVGQFKISQELTIGRSPNNEVVLKEPRVSRRHAVIRQSGNQYMVIDNNSSNGTYVNGHTVTEQVLRSGDKLQVGSFELVFTS